MPGTLKLETEMTIRSGKVVWDLNGLAENEVGLIKLNPWKSGYF